MMKIKASKVSTRVHTEVYGGTQGRKVTPDENLQSLLQYSFRNCSHGTAACDRAYWDFAKRGEEVGYDIMVLTMVYVLYQKVPAAFTY